MASFGRSARPRLIEPAGYASAARAELAVCIAKRTTAQAHLAQIEDADISGQRRKAQRDVEAAQTALDATAEGEAANVVIGKDAGQSGVPAARAAVAAAQDRLNTLLRAEKLEPERKADAEQAISEAIATVKKAALIVLREHPFVSALLDRLERAEREYLGVLGAFNFLANVNALVNTTDWGTNLDDSQSKRIRVAGSRTNQTPASWMFENPPSPGPFADRTWVSASVLLNASAAPWAEAFRELQNDAHAPLPAASGTV